MKKVKMGIKDLPILGNAQIPVRIMQYSHKKDKKRFFQSGFAFFGIADDQADVTGPNGEDLGSLGGKMGGHYEMRKKDDDENITVIISVQDLWNEISNLLGSENVQLQLEGIEPTYKKYWEKHEKLEAIAEMQEEAEKAEKKRITEKMAKDLKKREEAAELKEKESLKIIDNNGWDLDKEIPDYDYHTEDDFQIPVNLGDGVKIIKDGVAYTSKHRGTPTVTLDITTWRGTAAIGAIHYYGELKIGLPEFVQDDQKRYTCSMWDIPLFKNTRINLTHVLEQWEIDRYPDNYQDQRPGYHIRGFYQPEGAKRAAKEFFEKHFGPGWKLKIEEHY
jgi:hypothetical protein